jgi:hypothetical protein
MPTKAGDTSRALAAMGAITGKVSKAMDTMAWMNRVARRGSKFMCCRLCKLNYLIFF